MNDFKEYSAAFQDHQNSLMHYGVKGMKWRHHKRSLKEWWNGGDSRKKADEAKEKAQNKRIDYALEVGYHREGLMKNSNDPGVARINSYDPDKDRRMDNLIAYDNKHHRHNSLEKLDADYYRKDAKAKVAYGKSAKASLERSAKALKDTLKSVSLNDYKEFYGKMFKKKKKK